jgi:hypothetical protein
MADANEELENPAADPGVDASDDDSDDPSDDGSDGEDPADRLELEEALTWIGYAAAQQVTALADELGSLKEFGNYSYKDISAMVKDGVRYGINQKLKFPLTRQKRLKQVIDWAKDRQRINEPISLAAAAITTQAQFLSAIKLAHERKEIREKEKDAHDAQLKAASPGKLKDEKIWEDWLTGLQTMLTLMCSTR